MRQIRFLFLCFCFLFSAFLHGATISDIRLGSPSEGISRVAIDVSPKTEPTVFQLTKPNRLVVDFANSAFTQNALKKKFSPLGLINGIRQGKQQKTARIVIDLPKKNIYYKYFLTPSDNPRKWRFVVDISLSAGKKKQNSTDTKTSSKKTATKKTTTTKTNATKTTPAKTTTQKDAPSAKSSAKTSQNDAPKATSRTTTTQASASSEPAPTVKPKKSVLSPLKPISGKKKIMLDPGHGGKDPGAISRSGKYEKDLTLKMALELRPILEKRGFQVFMTRDKDVALALRQRVKKAHAAQVDLFISIHADSAKNKNSRGLSIYTISEKASDKEAAALAERENKADIILGMDLSDYRSDISDILIDLAKRDTMDKSAIYAKLVIRAMQKQIKLVPNAHRFAGFAVLKSPNIPSVLLEMGYLSNKQEEKLLQKSSYRKKLAESLADAVEQYFKKI